MNAMRRMQDREGLTRLTAIVAALAVAVSMLVVTLGAIATAVSDSYTVRDYLNDLRGLVIGLAFVLIALELPAAISRRLSAHDQETTS